MIETSSVPPQKSLATFGNLWQSSAIFGDVRQAFGEQFWKIFGNLRNVVGNLQKIVKNSVFIINRIIHGRLEIWNLSSRVHIDTSRVRCAHSFDIECEHEKINSISPSVHVLFSISVFLLLLSL